MVVLAINRVSQSHQKWLIQNQSELTFFVPFSPFKRNDLDSQNEVELVRLFFPPIMNVCVCVVYAGGDFNARKIMRIQRTSGGAWVADFLGGICITPFAELTCMIDILCQFRALYTVLLPFE